MVFWAGIANIVTSFYGMASLILIGGMYYRMRTKSLLWLLVLSASTSFMLLIFSTLTMTSYYLTASRGTVQGSYYQFRYAGGIILFLLLMAYHGSVNISVQMLTSAKRRKLADNIFLGLILVILTLGLYDYAFGGNFDTELILSYKGAIFISRDISMLYALSRLIVLKKQDAAPFRMRVRHALMPVITVGLLLWLSNDIIWYIMGRRVILFDDAISFFLLNTLALYFIIRYLIIETKKLVNTDKSDYTLKVGLSSREGEVFELLVAGRHYKEIAEDLHISVDTVKSHASSIYRKTGARGREPLKKSLYEYLHDFTLFSLF